MSITSEQTLSMLALTAFATTQSASAASLQNDAFVRVVHASPAAGTVDVYVDGAKLLSNFTFGSVTGYVMVPAGPHKIQVAPAGKGISASVITQTVSVAAGVPYTVAAVGTASTGFSLAAFGDDNLLSFPKHSAMAWCTASSQSVYSKGHQPLHSKWQQSQVYQECPTLVATRML